MNNSESQENTHGMFKEMLWESLPYNGYKYGVSIAKMHEIDEVCERVSAETILEVWHLFRMSVHDALQESVEKGMDEWGAPAYSLYRENEYTKEVIGMGGVVPLTSAGNTVGEIWFIGSEMEMHSRFVARETRELLRIFFEKHLIFINVVGTWNKRCIRWLRYLGFVVEEKPQYMGMNKALFHRFYMTKQMFDAKFHINTKTEEEKICV